MNPNIPIPDYVPALPDSISKGADERLYRRWREAKLAAYPTRAEELAVEIADPHRLTDGERSRTLSNCRRANFALLILTRPDHRTPRALRRLGEQIGLRRLDRNLCAEPDGISAIRVTERPRPNEYIPYTSKPLSWHTDGYYNAPEQQIRAWSLLCVQQAVEGGENALLDHEIVYILLRDEDPELIRALMATDAMTIPANREAGRVVRPARTGPVFSVSARDGSLHMRYSARQRNIAWKADAATRAAVSRLVGLFSSASPYILRHCLEPGQVLVSNNVLHNRSGFRESADSTRRRLLYRARYFDRIAAL
jgi:hypothetical protein